MDCHHFGAEEERRGEERRGEERIP